MIKTCILCGEQFECKSKRLICFNTHTFKCEWCGKEFEIKTPKHNVCCSKECANALGKQHREQTSLERYGVANAGGTEESKAKIRATTLERLGVECSFQSDIVKKKIADTNQQRYGVVNPQQNADIKKKTQQTCVERYGDTNVLGKNSLLRTEIAKANLEKYGTTDPGNLPEFIAKRRNTNLQRYGAISLMKLPAHRERVKQTNLRKYGTVSPLSSPIVIEKIKATNLERYGDEVPMHTEIVKNRLKQSNMSKFGSPWFITTKAFQDSQGNRISKINQAFAIELNKLEIATEFEFRIDAKSYDIHILNTNILVEIDPTFTHTSHNTKYGNLTTTYHQEKSKLAESHGYRCIHIFDWDDWNKIINILKPKSKLFARKCEVVEVDEVLCSQFEDQHHLQGSCQGQEIRLGLIYNDELVQIMTFGAPRYNPQYQWELLRLCTKSDYTITGGSEKLFKHFIEQCNPESIISYCDRSKFSGQVYSSLGFNTLHTNSPSRHWSKGHKQITDNLLRQRGYDQLFGTNFGKGTSNEELMLQNGWLPVYDCGQTSYEWRAK